MNALAADLIRQTAELSESVTRPIPGSRKIHVSELRVPMREVALSDTPLVFGAEKNAPLALYDTSGPYTDPDARIDLAAGLEPLRGRWIGQGTQDVEPCSVAQGEIEDGEIGFELPDRSDRVLRVRRAAHHMHAGFVLQSLPYAARQQVAIFHQVHRQNSASRLRHHDFTPIAQ